MQGKKVKNHTAEGSQKHWPVKIIFIHYCKIALLCSTWGMAMAGTVFTGRKRHKPTINLTQSVIQSSAAVLTGKTGLRVSYLLQTPGGFQSLLSHESSKLISEYDRLHLTAYKYIRISVVRSKFWRSEVLNSIWMVGDISGQADMLCYKKLHSLR